MIHERKITVEASSIEEALNDVSGRWQIPAEKLHAEVLGEERKGFLGLGGKTLRVEITANLDENHDAKGDKDTRQENLLLRGADFLNTTLKLMDFNAQAVISESDKNTLDIQGEDASDYVVGRYGDALKGMEYLVNLALRDPKFEPRIKINSCGYRERRTKSLERLAEATARQAVKYSRPVRLEPMASWERWVIHTTLKDRNDITTESVGEPPMRKVVVMPKYDPERDGAAGPATMRIRARRERIIGPVSRPVGRQGRPPRRGSRRSDKQ